MSAIHTAHIAHTATAEATATEDATWDATEIDGPNERVGKCEKYIEKVSVGVKTAEASRAGVSASTTSASNITSTTFYRAAEAFFQTKTELEQIHDRQHEVFWPLIEVTATELVLQNKLISNESLRCPGN